MMMTPSETLLGLYRRKGNDETPVSMYFCHPPIKNMRCTYVLFHVFIVALTISLYPCQLFGDTVVDIRKFSDNLVNNGDFRQAADVAWVLPEFNTRTCRYLSPSIEKDAESNESLCFHGRENEQGAWIQSVSPWSGKVRLSARMKAEGIAPGWEGRVVVRLQGIDPQTRKEFWRSYSLKTSVVGTTFDWRDFSREFEIPEGTHRSSVELHLAPKDPGGTSVNSGTVWFGDIKLVPILSEQELEKAPGLLLASCRGGGEAGVYMPEQSVHFSPRIRNNRNVNQAFDLQVEVRDFYGDLVFDQSVTSGVDALEDKFIELSIPAQPKQGFYSLALTLKDSGGAQVSRMVRSFCVVEPLSGVNDPSWGMAVQRTAPCLAKAYRMLGVGRILLRFSWKSEILPGVYDWAGRDREIDEYLQNGIQPMGVLYTHYPESAQDPGWINERKALSGMDDAYYRRFESFAEQLVDRYKDKINIWDVFSEVDALAAGHGDLFKDYYINRVRAFCRGAHRADPSCRVVGLEATTADAQAGYPVLRELWTSLKDDLDSIWPHPYPVPRRIGPSANAQPPEMHVRQFLAEASEIGGEQGKPLVGISEIGYALRENLDVDSQYQMEMASLTARTMILARSLPEFEYYGQFLSVEAPSDDALYTYGLWEKEYTGNQHNPMSETVYPRPALAAYSTVARMLSNTSSQKLLKTDKNIYACYFKKDDGWIIALWGLIENNELKWTLNLPEAVEVYDIMGNLVKKLDAGSQTIVLTDSPIFLRAGAEKDDILGAVGSAQSSQPKICSFTRLKTMDSLEVTLSNQPQEDLGLTLRVPQVEGLTGAIEKAVVLPADGKETVVLKFDHAVSADLMGREIVISAIFEDESVYNIKYIIDFLPIYKRVGKEIRIDGNLAEYEGVAPVELTSLFPPDSVAWKLWENKYDLSAKAWLLWDEQRLYGAVAVEDDVHIMQEVPRQMWRHDNMMLAIDAGNDALPFNLSGKNGYDGNDCEFDFGLGKAGPQTYCWQAPALPVGEEITGLKFSAVRNGGMTVYEFSIPWETIMSASPEAGRAMGLNIVVSDADKVRIRQCWLGITQGIHTGKNPELYKPFVLLPAGMVMDLQGEAESMPSGTDAHDVSSGGGNDIINMFETTRTDQEELEVSAGLKDLSVLQVNLENQLNKSLDLIVKINLPDGVKCRATTSRLTLLPLEKQKVLFEFDELLPPKMNNRTISVTVRSDSGKEYVADCPVKFSPLVKKDVGMDIRVDGVLDEYKHIPSMKLSAHLPSGRIWRGPGDISAKCWILWDTNRLYLAVEAFDDVHVQELDPRQMWKQDNVLFCIRPGSGEKNTCLRLGLGKNGPQTYCWSSPVLPIGEDIKGSSFAVQRKGMKTCYEFSIPWEIITEQELKDGALMYLRVVVEDADEPVLRQFSVALDKKGKAFALMP